MTDRDSDITERLWARDEDGIARLRGRHGRLGMQIAYNILQNEADAEECLADALQAMWEQIPPNQPEPLLPSWSCAFSWSSSELPLPERQLSLPSWSRASLLPSSELPLPELQALPP